MKQIEECYTAENAKQAKAFKNKIGEKDAELDELCDKIKVLTTKENNLTCLLAEKSKSFANLFKENLQLQTTIRDSQEERKYLKGRVRSLEEELINTQIHVNTTKCEIHEMTNKLTGVPYSNDNAYASNVYSTPAIFNANISKSCSSASKGVFLVSSFFC